MEHIRQKNSSELEGLTYTVVVTTNWVLPLSEHPSIVQHPDLFEIVNNTIPENVQYLNYI